MTPYCPVCPPKTILRRHPLEAGLLSWNCTACEGHWISHASWLVWMESGGAQAEEAEVTPPTNDSPKAKICRDCGRLMMRYNAGGTPDFMIDRCTGCGGVWSDQNEWDALKQRGLVNTLPQIFSQSWQLALRRRQFDEQVERRMQSELGDADWQQVKTFHHWLESLEQAPMVLAYLQDHAVPKPKTATDPT